MTRRGILFAILLLPCMVSQAQDWKRTQNWYFGDKAGLSFATNPPTALTNGMMGAIEGSATISDTNGNLLFYTEGNNIWNRNHQLMANGTGLLGHGSSTQAALIVPQPGNDSLFYVFTTAQTGQPNGFRYSIVNLSRNGGLGEVILKNVLLQTPVCEKLAATKHANGKDIWVLAHGFGNDLFYAYLVTEYGIVSCPVVSKIGSVHTTNFLSNAQGAMKFSPSGRILGVTVYDINQQKIDFFDFNSSDGNLTGYHHIPWVNLGYGIEFSGNEKQVYITTRLNNIYQYQITSKNADTIKSTEHRVYSGPNSLDSYYGSLQLSTDNKIYISLVDSSFIGVINHPDSAGSACDFQEVGLDLSPKISKYGLPNFVSSYFYRPSADYGYDLDCQTNTAVFTAKDTIGATQYQWSMSKTDTQSFTGNPLVYQFTDTGNFNVALVAINGTDTAIQIKQVFIHPTYSLDLGKDTVLCFGQNLLLDASSGQRCYLWNDSSMGYSLFVDTGGLYHIKVVSDGFCFYFDSIRVSFIPSPPSTIQIARSGDTLFADDDFDRYTWFNNNTEVQDSSLSYLLLTGKGSYTVTGSDSLGCFSVSSIEFQVDTLTSIVTPVMSDFIIYPNPLQEGMTLTIYSDQDISNIKLTDISGKPLLEKQAVKDHTFKINYLPTGVYILTINQLHNYKIIVK